MQSPEKKMEQSTDPNSFNKDCSFEKNRKLYKKKWGILLKTNSQIDGIRQACKTAKTILDSICEFAKEGAALYELEEISDSLHKKYGVTPAPLGYGDPPFPATICTSINEVVCHGIPRNQILKNGDIVNIDVTVIQNGFFGDCSKMVCIGDIDEEKKNVVETSLICLNEAISILKPGIMLCEIGNIITSIAHSKGCSVVDSFVGHGVGVNFHEEPAIFHSKNNIKIPLCTGMTFTIEPMINAGRKECVIDRNDMWTARTIDNKPSAQWEHTIFITDHGSEILTAS